MDKNHVCKLPPGGPVDIPAFVRCSSCVGTSAAPDTEPARAMPRITTGSSTLCSRYPSASPAATATKCKPAQEKSTAVGKSSGSKAHGMQLNLGKLNGGTAQQSAVAASNTVPFSPRSWEVASYYYRFVQQSPRVYELAPRHDAHTSTPSSSALSDAPTPKKKLMGVLKATPGICCLCSWTDGTLVW